MNIELALANLKRHGFDAVYFDTAAQAAEYVADELKGMSAGIGGSKTVEAMGLYETLAKQGEVYWHWKQPTAEERDRAAHAQAYLSSANGISSARRFALACNISLSIAPPLCKTGTAVPSPLLLQ